MTRAAIFPLCLLACVLVTEANLLPLGFPLRMMRMAKTAREAAPDVSARDAADTAAQLDDEIRNLVDKINGMKKRESADDEDMDHLPNWLDSAFRKRDVEDSMNLFSWMGAGFHKRDTDTGSMFNWLAGGFHKRDDDADADVDQQMGDIARKIDGAMKKRDDEAAQNVGDIFNKIDGVFQKRDSENPQPVSDVLGTLNNVIDRLNSADKRRRSFLGL